MSTSLSKILNELDSSLTASSISHFVINQATVSIVLTSAIEKEIGQKEDEFLRKLDNLYDLIFRNISLFILQGEYLNILGSRKELSEIKTKVSDLQKQFIFDYTGVIPEVIDYYDKVNESYQEKIAIPFKDLNSIALQFLEKIEGYATLRNREIIFNIDEHNSSVSFYQSDGSDKTFLSLITKVSEIDHHLSYSISLLETLITIKNTLNKQESSIKATPVFELLYTKTCHLIYKLVVVLELDEIKKGSGGKKVYVIDSEYEELDKSGFKSSHLKSWEDNLKSHYVSIGEHKIRREDVTKILEKCGRKDITGLNLKLFHDAVKHSKDIEKSLPNLISISKLFENYYFSVMNGSETEFDSFSYKVARNYVANNRFSMAIEECDTIEKLKDELALIINIQSETGIKNFFPYYKAVEKLSLIIESNLNKEYLRDGNFEGKIKELESSIKTFEQYIQKWELYISWCQKVNFLSFRLSQLESCEDITLKSGEYKLFMASSYILPFDYESKKEELKRYNNKLVQFESHISILKTSKSQLEDVDRVMVAVGSQERKFIEILAIFAAIVLFTSGSIQAFNKERSFGDTLMFLGVFGVSLVLFVVLIKSILHQKPITNGGKWNSFFKDANFIASLSLGLVIFFASFFVYSEREKRINEGIEEKALLSHILPLSKPSFEQSWLDSLNQYEKPFTKNDQIKPGKLPWVQFISGNSKLLILAPHATSQIREGKVKRADAGTGSIAVFLNKRFGIPVLYTTYQSPSDPNYYDNNMFKDTLDEIIKLVNPTFVIDLHGSDFSKPYDLDLGTMNNISYLQEKGLFIKLINVLKSNGLNYISQDYFPAAKNQTDTKWLYNHNIPCVQLEINSNYLIRPDSSFNNETFLFNQKSSQLLQALVDFKKIVDKD
jgi:hypothetical protein